MRSSKTNITRLIKSEALRLGFSACGISGVRYLEEDARHLEHWLKQGYNAGMTYMNEHFDYRLNPQLLLPGAKSVVSVLFNYYTGKSQTNADAPAISKYAQIPDYHPIIKSKLNYLIEIIRQHTGDVSGKAYVDSGPLLEKAWARNSGLGWIGKNSILLSSDNGSFFFTGTIILDIELEYDQPITNLCGTCTLCIEICPMGAIVSPSVIDARRCISYLTIEMKENIPADIIPKLENHIFGCDICQDVCPWNNKNNTRKTSELSPVNEVLSMTKEGWYCLTSERFREIFSGTPVKRVRYEKLIDTITKMSGLTKSDTKPISL